MPVPSARKDMMMTMHMLPIALLLAAPAGPAQTTPGVSGNWIVQDRSAVIAIAPCGSRVCGRIARALIRKPGHPDTDVRNPDPSLRRKPLIGLQILSGFVPDGDRWDQGSIYDPESGKSYRSILRLGPDGSLNVSGCILFICRTQRWTRER